MNQLRIFFLLLCLCIQTILQGFTAYAISEFNILELEQNSKKISTFSHACQINNFGQVVGYCTYNEKINGVLEQKYAIFTWNNNAGFKIIATDKEYKRFPVINDAGVVAWTTHLNKGQGASPAYWWDPIENKTTAIPYSYFYEKSSINALNNKNELLLTTSRLIKIDPSNPEKHSPSFINAYEFYRENFGRGTINSFYELNKGLVAINNNSKVLGFYKFNCKGNHTHGFIWDAKNGIHDIGDDVMPYDINDFEQVVGRLKNDAFLWEGEKIKIIKSNAKATSINNLGDIVGNMKFQANSPKQTAFIFTEGNVYDLLSLVMDNDGWSSLEYAADINDAKQIVGYGYRYGKLTAFVLTPKQ